MKKIGSILSVVVLVGILLSSCASQKNGLAIKRKYNKGYYIAHNHKKNNESVKENNTDKVVKVTESKKLNVVEAELPPVKTILSVVNSENLPVAKAEKINEVKHNTVIIDSKNATASTVTEKTKTVHKEVNIEKKSAKSSSGSSDSQLILLVILSLFPFLALLAMYLKDGKQVTLNFWVDLILHLTFIGYIIFALLVVFDVVNLA
jgi:nitrous oxide reductase